LICANTIKKAAGNNRYNSTDLKAILLNINAMPMLNKITGLNE
jgi:hypothetical protein